MIVASKPMGRRVADATCRFCYPLCDAWTEMHLKSQAFREVYQELIDESPQISN